VRYRQGFKTSASAVFQNWSQSGNVICCGHAHYRGRYSNKFDSEKQPSKTLANILMHPRWNDEWLL